MRSKSRVLFVCVENAGRSQMAEAFARQYGFSALSGGTVPAERVNPVVVEAMREKGIHLNSARPKRLTAEMINGADLVVTMGCAVDEVCPKPLLAKMEKKLLEWHIDDPKGKSIEDIRRIRDQIEAKIREISTHIQNQNKDEGN